jgi:hypothetical protein
MRALHLRVLFHKQLENSGFNFNLKYMQQGWHERHNDHAAYWEAEGPCFEFRHKQEIFYSAVSRTAPTTSKEVTYGFS